MAKINEPIRRIGFYFSAIGFGICISMVLNPDLFTFPKALLVIAMMLAALWFQGDSKQ